MTRTTDRDLDRQWAAHLDQVGKCDAPAEDQDRPGCACGAPASACSWEGDTRRSWACGPCHQAEAAAPLGLAQDRGFLQAGIDANRSLAETTEDPQEAEAATARAAELRAALQGLDGRLGLDSRAEIAEARAWLTDWPIGPQTAYALIARALAAAAEGRHGYEALANALDAVLQERGYLDPEAGQD
jgi:hypothetical protein